MDMMDCSSFWYSYASNIMSPADTDEAVE